LGDEEPGATGSAEDIAAGWDTRAKLPSGIENRE
jgi:hypothetical protein